MVPLAALMSDASRPKSSRDPMIQISLVGSAKKISIAVPSIAPFFFTEYRLDDEPVQLQLWVRIFCLQSRRRARCRTGPWAFYKSRDDGIVPLICPTCQNVFAGSLKASMPATTMLLCMGLFFDILVESESRVGLAAVFPVDDRRMACRAVAR